MTRTSKVDGTSVAGAPKPAIFFLSDYGLVDEFVGVVHAVIHQRAPGITVIDLCHQVPHFDVAAGASTLERSVSHLGSGAVLAVVDPGVAAGRRALAVRVGTGSASPEWLVGPDNGVLAPAIHTLGGAREVYVLAGPGRSTFDGRDRLAPAAAHLVTGGDPAVLGQRADPGTLELGPPLPADRTAGGSIVTSVSHLDTFGNVQLHAGPELLEQLETRGRLEALEVTVGTGPRTRSMRARRVGAFAELRAGELGILVDANGRLALVLDRARASDLFDLESDPATVVRLSPPA